MIANDVPVDAGNVVPNGDWSAALSTREGFNFHVRSANPADEAALAEFFTHVTPEDLRFRFLTALRQVDHDRLVAMTHVDHKKTENFLAFEPGATTIIATAMLAADEALEKAEVAIAIRSDYKHRGVSWTLLEHVARFAEAKGFKSIESIESRDNHAAIELEREMGFVALPCPGDPTLVIVRATLGQKQPNVPALA